MQNAPTGRGRVQDEGEHERPPQASGGETRPAVEEPRYPIGSVDNALRLLLLLREQRFIRVAEASEVLGVVRSTAHRLLAMLQYRGFVQQDPETKAYSAGPALIDIGLSAVGQMDIRRHLRPCLERLSRTVGETTHLVVLDGAACLFIDSVESTRALRTSSRVGRSFPAHVTSGGKVLLAELPPGRLRELYPESRLPRTSLNSVVRRAELERELELVRERGHATNHGESESEIGAVAVPVRNSFGHAVAAVAISMPLSRLDDSAVPEIASTMTSLLADTGKLLV